MNMIRSKLDELSAIMSLRSHVFSEYFNTLMKNHNIKSIRNGFKVLIFYYYCEIVSSHMSQRGIVFRPVVALFGFCIFFLVFAATLNVDETALMTKLSSIMVVMCMIYTVLLGTDINEVMETHYSLTVVTILMMYTLFRLKFMITMLLSVIYIIVFLAIVKYRYRFILILNLTETNISALRQVRITNLNELSDNNFLFSQTMLFLLVYLTGIYLRFFNSVRRKSAFLKLAQNAESKLKMNSAIQVQTYWIEAIMPSSVKEEFLKHSRNKEMFDLVYCKKFENVSILFADIVGFTEMSSNKTAAQLVYLLNDLYNRFDEHGKVTNCEKIATLGDCYYCVSGCPVPRLDHAMCCVEMGLGMCRLILKFNKEHLENVNMRVGVHSGKVIAAIIGNHRFRFDVFSNDVIVANALETTGEPGLVHVSEDTFKLVRHAYVFKEGENLEIKKEEVFGLSGMIQKSVMIKTYFVIPNGSIRRRSMVSFRHVHSNNNANYYRNNVTGRLFGDRSKANKKFQRKDAKMKDDLNLIRALQRDPERSVEFFQNPPINAFFLTFNDREIETHYLYHSIDQIKRIQIDSMKVAPMIDAITCLIYSSILLLAAYIMMPKAEGFNYYTPIWYTSGIVVTIITSWTSLIFRSEIHFKYVRKVFYLCTHPISRLLLNVYMSSLPSLLVLTLLNQVEKRENLNINCYFTLLFFALIGNTIFTASYSSIKNISTATFTIIAITSLIQPFKKPSLSSNSTNSCTSYLMDHMSIGNERHEFSLSFQLVHLFSLIYFLTRENEKNVRIHFYASREAEIRTDEARREKKIAEGLLYNIIPKYVFAHIVSNKVSKQKNMRFSYAHAIPNAGVLFAGVSNFFSSYYREDYKSGEVALKLLHTIICTFDDLLRKPIYSQVEKIKTINDCYMVASGLNTNTDTNSDESHLINLLNFAFDMKQNLYTFNEKNIIGNDIFKLKIGYNFGPVTAGIIGNTRPLYDIWGDTVNVASRMYSTAPSGYIQVPDYVEQKLNQYFEFQVRGNVSIKGKGQMSTCLVTKVLNVPGTQKKVIIST